MSHNPATSFTFEFRVGPDSVQGIFLHRAVPALERIVKGTSASALAAALAASTDAELLAQLLARPEIVGGATTELNPFAPALARNIEHRKQLLERAGGTVSAEEAGRILAGISSAAVDERRNANTLLALREGNDWRYPICQFVDGTVIPGFVDVIRELGEQGAWVTLDFLLASDLVLGGRTPLQALQDGDIDAVRRLVRINLGDGFA
jgi:hypothetical protein